MKTFEGHAYMSIRVHGTSDEKIFMTRTVCKTIVLFLLLESDQCVTRYTGSKSDKVENKRYNCGPSR